MKTKFNEETFDFTKYLDRIPSDVKKPDLTCKKWGSWNENQDAKYCSNCGSNFLLSKENDWAKYYDEITKRKKIVKQLVIEMENELFQILNISYYEKKYEILEIGKRLVDDYEIDPAAFLSQFENIYKEMKNVIECLPDNFRK